MADQVIDIVMATPGAIPDLARSFVASWGTFDNDAVALVAVVDGQAVGTVTLKSDDWRPREDLSPWLGGLFVLPEHRGRGIAGRLVAALPEEARHRGIKILYTDCHAATVLLPGWQRIENSPLYSLDLATGA